MAAEIGVGMIMARVGFGGGETVEGRAESAPAFGSGRFTDGARPY